MNKMKNIIQFCFKNTEINRKLLHALFGLFVVSIYHCNESFVKNTLIALAFLIISFDYSIKKFITNDHLKTLIYRKSELSDKNKKSGAFWFGLGIFCSVIFFTKKYYMPAMLILSFCDALSSIIGRRFGKIKLFQTQKSFQGMLGFLLGGVFVIPLAVMADVNIAIYALGLTILTCSILEIIESIDDNFSILLGGTISMAFFSSIFF
jgi:dolichol kinase